MKLPEYFERFVKHVWPNKPQHWAALVDELIDAASDGNGNDYSLRTGHNLCLSHGRRIDPTSLDYFGVPTKLPKSYRKDYR